MNDTGVLKEIKFQCHKKTVFLKNKIHIEIKYLKKYINAL